VMMSAIITSKMTPWLMQPPDLGYSIERSERTAPGANGLLGVRLQLSPYLGPHIHPDAQ
jgi:hypothetical protein